jgi:hypothetical protein
VSATTASICPGFLIGVVAPRDQQRLDKRTDEPHLLFFSVKRREIHQASPGRPAEERLTLAFGELAQSFEIPRDVTSVAVRR